MAISCMIVVGLGGATFNLLKPWVAEGKLPISSIRRRRWSRYEMSDQDRRAIEGTLEGLGYL
jgi:hypothetical protein